MSKVVDLELKKAFTELQQKMIETKTKLQLGELQIEGLKRSKQHAELTAVEIKHLLNSPQEHVMRWFLACKASPCSRPSVRDITSYLEVALFLQNTADLEEKTLINNRSTLHRSLMRNSVDFGSDGGMGLTPDTKTYESVGRMFVLTDMSDVCTNLATRIDNCNEKIKSLESNMSYLERSLKDSENNLREMVQQRKHAAQEAT